METEIHFPKQLLNLSEQFFGKDKDLLDIEKCFQDLKDLEKKETNFTRKATVYYRSEASEIYNKIETILEKKFNVSDVVLMITGNMNAFTIPALAYIGDPVKFLSGETFSFTKTSNEYKFENTYPLMFINLGVPLIQSLSPAEITAIILHEVGHNFYHISLIQKLFFVIWTLPLLIIYALLSIFRVDYNKNVSESPVTEKINVIVNAIAMPLISLILNPVNTVFSALRSNSDKFKGNIVSRYIYFILQKLVNGVSYISNLPGLVMSMLQQAISFVTGDGMDNEKFADNFASMYGYGADISTALQKMQNMSDGNILEEEDVKYTKFVVQLANELNEVMSMLFHVLGVHPGTEYRTIDQMEYINKEINSNSDPRVKAALEKEKDRLKKSFEALRNKNDKFGGKYGSALHFYLDSLKSNLSINNKTVRNMQMNNTPMEKMGFKLKGTGYEK